MSKRGSVILHVLVTGIVVALIAACILRVATMSYVQTARTNAQTQQVRSDDGALARVSAYWAANGACSDGAGYTCNSHGAAPVGICGCTCTSSMPTEPTIYTQGSVAAGGTCTLSITAVDPLASAPY
jgi:hypothetical protein